MDATLRRLLDAQTIRPTGQLQPLGGGDSAAVYALETSQGQSVTARGARKPFAWRLMVGQRIDNYPWPCLDRPCRLSSLFRCGYCHADAVWFAG